MSVLEKIDSPADLKKVSNQELEELASEIRTAVLHKVSNIGGHVGPNLGVTELTIALHKVFNSPIDKFIWDVSHQTYPHKILTGRKNGFTDGHFHDITPYTSQRESEHDFFTVGHTSTSIANALGYAKARDLTNDKGNIVAVIGDGSLSGGLAMEALNNAGDFKGNLIILVNDNLEEYNEITVLDCIIILLASLMTWGIVIPTVLTRYDFDKFFNTVLIKRTPK